MVTFTEEIFNGRLHFLRSVYCEIVCMLFADCNLCFRSCNLYFLIGCVGRITSRLSLRGKYSNTEFFLVRIFQYSDQKKILILTLFTQCAFTKSEPDSFTVEEIGKVFVQCNTLLLYLGMHTQKNASVKRPFQKH